MRTKSCCRCTRPRSCSCCIGLTMATSDQYDTVIVGIGGKGQFSDATLRRMRDAPRQMLRHNPHAELALFVSGYDDDPRSLWHIPEAADYIRRFAKASGLHDWTGSLFKALHEHSKGLLIACDAIDKPHPFGVDIVPDA